MPHAGKLRLASAVAPGAYALLISVMVNVMPLNVPHRLMHSDTQHDRNDYDYALMPITYLLPLPRDTFLTCLAEIRFLEGYTRKLRSRSRATGEASGRSFSNGIGGFSGKTILW